MLEWLKKALMAHFVLKLVEDFWKFCNKWDQILIFWNEGEKVRMRISCCFPVESLNTPCTECHQVSVRNIRLCVLIDSQRQRVSVNDMILMKKKHHVHCKWIRYVFKREKYLNESITKNWGRIYYEEMDVFGMTKILWCFYHCVTCFFLFFFYHPILYFMWIR